MFVCVSVCVEIYIYIYTERMSMYGNVCNVEICILLCKANERYLQMKYKK